jgi:hypothetical protein
MQQHSTESARPRESVGLFKQHRKRDFLLSVSFSFRSNLKDAQRARIFNFQDGLRTPNSAHFISSQHNTMRFRLFSTLAVKEARIIPMSARMKEERRAKIALKFGRKYNTLSIESARRYVKALGALDMREKKDRKNECAKIARLFADRGSAKYAPVKE